MTFSKLEKLYIVFLILVPIIVSIKSNYIFVTAITTGICSMSFVLLLTLKILTKLISIDNNIIKLLDIIQTKKLKKKEIEVIVGNVFPNDKIDLQL